MSNRTVRLLHVEDDALQRKLVAAMLSTLTEFSFAITWVDSEDAAVSEFEKGTEFVLLDYQLAQGNGLSCLQKLRQRDRLTPIIAMSGTASEEVAAELVEEGADDYISKADLTEDLLGHAVREALVRADAWRRHAPAPSTGADPLEQAFHELCRDFVSKLGPDFQTRLDAFATMARAAHTSLDRLRELFVSAAAAEGHPQACQRPLELELLLRLADDLSALEGAGEPG